MPDIFTKHPEIVRRILEEAGLKCGVEPKILERTAEETCQLVKENFLGEIYVHELNQINQLNYVSLTLLGILIIALFILFLILIKRKNKQKIVKGGE